MRMRLLVLPVIVALLTFFTIPVMAGDNSCFGPPPPPNGSSMTSTCTSNVHNQPIPVPLSVPCPPVPGIGVFTNANGVLHGTTNAQGFWLTGTVTGDFDFHSASFLPPPNPPPTPGLIIGTGHGTTWFGVEDQQKSLVNHFTENVQITLFDGRTIAAHANMDVTFNAHGQLTASPFNVHCN